MVCSPRSKPADHITLPCMETEMPMAYRVAPIPLPGGNSLSSIHAVFIRLDLLLRRRNLRVNVFFTSLEVMSAWSREAQCASHAKQGPYCSEEGAIGAIGAISQSRDQSEFHSVIAKISLR